MLGKSWNLSGTPEPKEKKDLKTKITQYIASDKFSEKLHDFSEFKECVKIMEKIRKENYPFIKEGDQKRIEGDVGKIFRSDGNAEKIFMEVMSNNAQIKCTGLISLFLQEGIKQYDPASQKASQALQSLLKNIVSLQNKISTHLSKKFPASETGMNKAIDEITSDYSAPQQRALKLPKVLDRNSKFSIRDYTCRTSRCELGR